MQVATIMTQIISVDAIGIKMNKPKNINRKLAFMVYLVVCAYLLVPVAADLTGKPFTFWKESYIKKEVAVIQWMDDKGWLEKGIGIYSDKSSEVAANMSTQEKYFKLSKIGYDGANIRNKPDLNDSETVTVVRGNVRLLYLNESSTEGSGKLWYKVKAPNGSIGWISSRLVQEVK